MRTSARRARSRVRTFLRFMLHMVVTWGKVTARAPPAAHSRLWPPRCSPAAARRASRARRPRPSSARCRRPQPRRTPRPRSSRATRGRARRSSRAPAASSCHTLAAANATGTVGPNLDEAKPDFQLATARVTLGKGVMPSFKGQLTDQQIADVAPLRRRRRPPADRAPGRIPAERRRLRGRPRPHADRRGRGAPAAHARGDRRARAAPACT